MTFPSAGAQIYYNEAGEPTGWDTYLGYGEGPDPDDFDDLDYDEDPDGGPEWVICNECGNEYEDGDPEIKKHTEETGHNRWS